MSVRIERWVYGGAGEGEGVAVPFTLPGELVEANPFAILEPSPARVNARCRHFGACGGCQYQHADGSTQVALKRGILEEILRDGGVGMLPEIQAHRAEPWGYRNRIRLRFGLVGGALEFGYNRRASNDFLPIEECPIAAPILLRAAAALLAALAEARGWGRQVVEAEFFTTADEGRVQMTLFVRSGQGLALGDLCGGLRRRLPELIGAGTVLVGASGKQAQPGEAWGAAGFQYAAAGWSYWVPRGSFFQVNRHLVDRLVELVTAGRTGALAWDLYAGVGLFSRALAERFAEVVSVEVAAAPGGATVVSTTGAFLQRAVLERDRPGLVVMDPPRAGLGPEVCALLARVQAPEMVYVSCDPTTLARDLKALVDSGYTIAQVHMVDLFPQTFHLETVVMLERQPPSPRAE